MVKRVNDSRWHTFDVMYEGTKAQVKMDKDLPFGKIESIQKQAIKFEDVMRGGLNLDISGYREAITVAAVVEAPWKVNDPIVFRSLPLSVGKKLVAEATLLYPLYDYLSELMKAIHGDIEDNKSVLETKVRALATGST